MEKVVWCWRLRLDDPAVALGGTVDAGGGETVCYGKLL